MRARNLKSNAIERAAYDEASHVLHVWFRGGARYCYSDVPRAIYDGLVRAPSAGRYFADAIRGCYPSSFDPERRRFRPAN